MANGVLERNFPIREAANQRLSKSCSIQSKFRLFSTNLFKHQDSSNLAGPAAPKICRLLSKQLEQWARKHIGQGRGV
jgi:hypothetical protein